MITSKSSFDNISTNTNSFEKFSKRISIIIFASINFASMILNTTIQTTIEKVVQITMMIIFRNLFQEIKKSSNFFDFIEFFDSIDEIVDVENVQRVR